MTTTTSSVMTLDSSISKIREDLHQLKVENKRTCLNNSSSRDRMKKHLETVSKRIKSMRTEQMAKGRASLTPYLQSIRSVVSNDHTQYVQTIEAKVCQALHYMAIGNDQIVRFENDCDQQLSELKSKCIEITNESTEFQLDIMNQISRVDDMRHNLRSAYLKVLQAQCALLRWYDIQRLEENNSNSLGVNNDVSEEESSPPSKLKEEENALSSKSEAYPPIFDSPVSVMQRTIVEQY